MYTSITSPTNEKIKHAIKLAASSKFRRENKEFILEGLRLCIDAAKSLPEIKWLFFTAAAYEKNGEQVDFLIEKSKLAFEISQPVCERLALTENSQGIFAVCSFLPEPSDDTLIHDKKYVALDNIQDPANLGAICRTAEALGVDGVIVQSGCDIYNPKAQRAAMGSLLRLPIIKSIDLPMLLNRAKENGMKLYATTPDSRAKKITRCSMKGGVIAVIGNEANGVSSAVLAECEKITIPMLGRAESLNASMAAAITMWEIMRGEG